MKKSDVETGAEVVDDDDDDDEYDEEAEAEKRHEAEEKKKEEKRRLERIDSICVVIAFIIIIAASVGDKNIKFQKKKTILSSLFRSGYLQKRLLSGSKEYNIYSSFTAGQILN